MRAATPLEARLLRRAMLACVLVLVSVTTLVAGLSPGSGLTGECDQGLRLGAFDGDFMAMLQGSYGQLGQYDLCQEYGRYCTLQLMFHCTLPDGTTSDTAIHSACGSTMNHVPTLSVCVPKTCTVATLNEQLQSTPVVSTAWWSLLLQTTFNLNGLSCLGDVTPYQSCLHNASFTYFSAVCLPDSGNPDREHWGSSPGPRAAVYAIGFFVVLCGAATLVSVGRSTFAGLRIMLFPAPPPLKDGASDASDATHTAVTAPLLGAVNHQTPASHDNAPEPRRRPSLVSRLFASLNYFNVVDNWYDFIKIVPRHNAAVDTRWMEGLRVISMCFVVYGHTLYFPQFATGWSNAVNAYQFITTYGAIGVYPAELAVDAFFFMSGYLFLYLYFNQVEKVFSKAVKERAHAQMDDGESEDNAPRLRPVGVVDTLLMYVHRYLRIAPVVGLVMLFTMYAAPLIPSGPLHGVPKHLASQCERDGSWWRVLLFFQNIHLQDILCMAWFWYLSCDFQMFLFAPIVCAIRFLRLEDALWFSASWRHTARGIEAKQPWLKKAGHVLFYLATLTFIVIAIEIASRKNTYQSPHLYSRSIARAGPYAYGFLFSALIREPWIRRHLDNGRVRFALYTAGTFALLLSVNLMWKAEAASIHAEMQQVFFGNFAYPMPPKSLLDGAQGCAQAFFGLGLGLFSLAWGSGHGGPLAHFLGHPLLSIVSKLTFCSYMLHPIVIVIFWAGARALPVWTVPSFYGYAACFLCWTFLSATVLHLGVEVPAAKLNNALTKRH